MSSIKKLACQLEKEIEIIMEEFVKMGKKAKQLQKDLDEIYITMANTFSDLQPVEYIIRYQYPNHCELFDKLLEFKASKENVGKN